jgi:hypothetical protein
MNYFIISDLSTDKKWKANKDKEKGNVEHAEKNDTENEKDNLGLNKTDRQTDKQKKAEIKNREKLR